MQNETNSTPSRREPTGESRTKALGVHAFGVTLLAAAVTIALPTILSGCNTTEGVGEDLEAVGDSISDEANDAN